MNKVQDHFEQESPEFDDIIIKLVPYYSQMLDSLISSVPFPEDGKIKVIDLGCGTATVSKMVKERFPLASIHCVDFADSMIESARRKLSGYSGITYENADLSAYSFVGSYDVAVSSLVLHHLLTDNDKKEFYSKVYGALNPGGVFYNADNVIGSNEVNQENCMVHWRQFMQRTISKDEIEQKWIKKYEEEDHPAQLVEQLNWLKDIGYKDIDVIWKYFNFAVYGGTHE